MESAGSGGRFETYYSILGVSKTVSTEEIDKAYRRVSLQVHPDKGGHAAAFRRVKRAHDVLKDPELRKRYDKYGSQLVPSPGDLIGSSTIGRLVPLSICATGGAACQLFWVMGALSAPVWFVGCLFTAGASWVKARATNGRADSALPAIMGGLLIGNVAGLCVGVASRGTVRWLTRR